MSQPFDRRAYLVEEITTITKEYLVNLKHVPEDKLAASPMGVARSPLTFTAECAGFNGWVADAIDGTIAPMPDKETRERFYASVDTYEKAEAALIGSRDKLISVIGRMEESDLDDITSTPWGEAMTKFKIATMCYMHMIYHDGQLNYIQTLYGDAEDHY